MKKNSYSVAQSVLYQTCRIILNNCKNNLAAFTAFAAMYTVTFITDLLKAVDDAEKLPGEQARALEHETLQKEMIAIAKTCRNLWQGLKRYITKAYSEEYWKMNWDAAGWQNYEQASNDNWDKVIAMMVEGSSYIATHKAALTQMPAGFEADFNAAKDSMQDKYSAFTQAETDASLGTDAKITANNDVYAQVIEVCQDGQYIYTDDDTMKELFSFEKMSQMVDPPGAAGLKGTVTEDGQPQAGLTVELENGNKTVITDAEGAFNFGNQLASGTDKLIIKNGDEILKEEDVIIPKGVTVNEKIELPGKP